MRNLRKFSVFLLFTALFAVLACSLFAKPLGDLAQNVRNGGGERTYVLAAQGADGKTYAVRALAGGGYRLLALSGAQRVSERALAEGLPADFEIASLHAAADGTVLLGIYERHGAHLIRYALYAAQEGEAFSLLLEAPLSGVTADARRQSAGVIGLAQEDALVRLTVLQEGVYSQYTFDPAREQGLVAQGTLTGEQAAALAAQNADALAQARQLVGSSGLDAARASYVAATPEGGALAILEEASLYAVSAAGAVSDLSAGLYRTVWHSALILAGLVLLVLALAYSFYFLVCEVKKLYFPLVAKTLLWLSLVGYVAVSATLLLFTAPGYRAGVRENAQAALAAQARQVQSVDEAGLRAAAQAMAETDFAFADCAAILFAQAGSGASAWSVQASSAEYPAGLAADMPGAMPGEAARLTLAVEKGADRAMAEINGTPYYFAYAPQADGSVLCLRMNARAVEQGMEARIRAMALYGYAAAALLILCAAWIAAGAARGARRVTKGIDLLSAGAPQVRVVHNAGDELTALAAAFNDLSGTLEERRAGAATEGSAYLRFVPRRLVALLGASSIEQVDKSTSASHEMAMMVVRFSFPRALYQSSGQALFDNINEVFAHIAGGVSGAGGAIYNFTYDGFDAVFESGAQAAVGAAVAVRQALLDLNAEREARGDAPVQLRVALDYGVALMGVVGDADRVVPTVVSSCLNTARGLVELADVLDANILCTAAVADAAGEYGMRYLGKARDGGALLRVYEIYDGDAYSVRLAKESMREQFSAGVYAMYSGEFSEAKRVFMDIARRQGEDGAARHYLYLADQFEKRPPEQVGLN